MNSGIEEFNKEEMFPIMVSEAKCLLEENKQRFTTARSIKALTHQKAFFSSLTHCETYGKIKSKSNMEDLRNVLKDNNLDDIEIALLGSLLPQSSEEAKVIIPSLNKLDDETLQYILKMAEQNI
ncbi:DNA-directed RNA polymerase II subunit rpb4 [Astathelohania contejeani]|uniref:DNA-directed RNA polymerase II subunit rpb4 n=1 Tax=Astathelohania contejeani TaxID=164912 RepID=A0ABQ7HWV7_9MICR|nr:DNA-directed RNA polymerase II subunit rpb4 [Thelohania contejeani]